MQPSGLMLQSPGLLGVDKSNCWHVSCVADTLRRTFCSFSTQMTDIEAFSLRWQYHPNHLRQEPWRAGSKDIPSCQLCQAIKPGKRLSIQQTENQTDFFWPWKKLSLTQSNQYWIVKNSIFGSLRVTHTFVMGWLSGTYLHRETCSESWSFKKQQPEYLLK